MSASSEVNLFSKKKFRGYAQSKAYLVEYTWEINELPTLIEFAKISEENTVINSTEFSLGVKVENNDLWYLQLKIKSKNKTQTKDSSPSAISVSLFRRNENRPLWIKYKLFFLNNENKKLQEISENVDGSLDWTYQILKCQQCIDGLSVRTSELLINRDKFLENNTLTVGVELVVYDNYVSVKNPGVSLTGSKQLLSEDFKDVLLGNKKLEYDVVVKVADKQFEAHKFMLIARSSVFEAMFSHNLEESKKNEIDIPDVEPLVFEKLLEFVYTDKVEDLNGCAEKLFEASDKYDLQGLKKMCNDFLSRNITSKNAITVMVLGYLHNGKRLMKLAVDHIVTNYTNFKNNEEFKALKESYPSLYFDILEKKIDGGNTSPIQSTPTGPTQSTLSGPTQSTLSGPTQSTLSGSVQSTLASGPIQSTLSGSVQPTSLFGISTTTSGFQFGQPNSFFSNKK